MMDSAGVFVLLMTIFNGSTEMETINQEFDTHAMCIYARDEYEKLLETDGYVRVVSSCFPKEEITE